MAVVYDNNYEPVSVYGNVISMAKDFARENGVHIDIGCGYGPIAEPIRDEVGLEYLGFDFAEDGLESLRSRGFSAVQLDLTNVLEAERIVRETVGVRPIASISLLDTIEHITNGAEVLEMLRRIAESDKACLFISVPNITHKDIAFKLLMGRFEYTESGLLDYTHVSFFDKRRLDWITKVAGWREIATRDWLLERSDQYSPANAAVFLVEQPLGRFLRSFVEGANPHALVNQFVRTYRPSVVEDLPLYEEPKQHESRQFLSIVVVVEIDRVDVLAAQLKSISEQTDSDCEVVVVLHRCNNGILDLVGKTIGRFPGMTDRSTIIEHLIGERASAQNVGLKASRGEYVLLLSDEAILLPEAVTVFKALAKHSGPTVMVAGSAPKYPGHSTGNPFLFPDSTEENVTVFPFSIGATTPESSNIAFPMNVLRDLGLRLDVDLPDGQVWDLAGRTAGFCGYLITPEFALQSTNDQKPGATVANPSGWSEAREIIISRRNSEVSLMPPGSYSRFQRLQEQNKWYGEKHVELVHALMTVSENKAREIEENNKTNDLILRKLSYYLKKDSQLSSFFAAYNIVLPADYVWEKEEENPLFLTVITRTQGRRNVFIKDMLLSLAAQSCQDFELYIVLHKCEPEKALEIRAIVDAYHEDFRNKIKILECYGEGRAAPLNQALSLANGKYVSVLDDDDFVFANWVEAFKELTVDAPLAVLRASCVKQTFDRHESGIGVHARATSWPMSEWPVTYDAVAHLHGNYSPFMSLAFPTVVFRELGLRFDETLETTEDWDLATRIVMLCGIITTPKITSVYRWWRNAESSSSIEGADTWDRNRKLIIEKFNAQPILLGGGAARQITDLMTDLQQRHQEVTNWIQRANSAELAVEELRKEIQSLQIQCDNLSRQYCECSAQRSWAERRFALSGVVFPWAITDEEAISTVRTRLERMLTSRSWRATQPLRYMIGRIVGDSSPQIKTDNLPSTFEECQRIIVEIRRSNSWRLALPIRFFGKIARRLVGKT